MTRLRRMYFRWCVSLWLGFVAAVASSSAVNYTNIVGVDFQAATTNKIQDAGAGNVLKTNFYTFAVAGLGNVVDLNFRLSILHSAIGDLDISLISPTGIQTPLTNILVSSIGGVSNNFQDTLIDQEGGSTRIDLGTPPFAGPEYPGGTRYMAQFTTDTLSKFKTINPNGTWTLKIVDQFFQDDGFLLWSGANPRALQKFLQDTNVGNSWGTNSSGTNALGTQLIFTVPCPSITGTVSGGGTICAGNSTNVTVTITGGAPPYVVTLNNGGGTKTNSSPLNFTVSPGSTTTYAISSAIDSNGCPVTASGNATVTVNANPSTPAIASTPSVLCANSTSNQASGPDGMTSYAWTISNGTITSATNLQTISYSAGASGTVTLNLTVANVSGCTAFGSTNIPIPLDTTPPQINCPGNILVSRDASITSGPVSFTVTASDNCTLSNVTTTPPSGSSFPFGTTLVTSVARDAAGNSNTCSFNVTVNRIPVAGTDNLQTLVNMPLSVPAANLLTNDNDGDGDPLSVVGVSATSTNGGSVTLSAGTVTYTPVSNFFGNDRFLYTLADNRGGTNAGTVLVNVMHPLGYLLTVRNATNAYRLDFIAVPGQSYFFQFATSPSGPWTNLFSPVTAGASGLIITNDTNQPFPETKLYRVTQ